MRTKAHYKTVMVGDSGVGKTSLVNRLTSNEFTDRHVATVGSQFIAVPMIVGDDEIILSLWDTAGQEIYRALVSYYARDARAAVIVCDVTATASFHNLEAWVQFVKDQAPECEIILFANKIDLDDRRTVGKEEFIERAKVLGYPGFEGSAQSGEGVRQAFACLAETLASKGIERLPQIDIDEYSKKKRRSCC